MRFSAIVHELIRQKKISSVFSAPMTGSALTLLLAACGGGGGSGAASGNAVSGGSSSGSSGSGATLSGNVVKGPLTGALVFVDTDGDGQLDDNEFSTTTGPGGAYTLNVPGGLPAGANIVVLTRGAKDESSGETLPADVILSAPANATVITPLTTLMVEADMTADELARVLGVDLGGASLTDYNPFDPANATSDVAKKLEAAAVLVTKTVSEIGSAQAAASNGTTTTATSLKAGVQAVAEFLKEKATAGQTFDTAEFGDASTLNTLVSKSATKIAALDSDAVIDQTLFNQQFDVAATATANAAFDANIKAADSLLSEATKALLAEINEGERAFNVVLLEPGAENALAPVLAFEYLVNRLEELGLTVEDGVFEANTAGTLVTVSWAGIDGKIEMAGTGLAVANDGSLAGDVSTISVSLPGIDGPVVRIETDITLARAKEVLVGLYLDETSYVNFSWLEDGIVSILVENATPLGAILENVMFTGADKYLFGTPYDDLFFFAESPLESDTQPGSSTVAGGGGADQFAIGLDGPNEYIGNVIITDFNVTNDVIDLSWAGISGDRIIASNFERDGTTGVRLQFDMDGDGILQADEVRRGAVTLEGVSLNEWNAAKSEAVLDSAFTTTTYDWSGVAPEIFPAGDGFDELVLGSDEAVGMNYIFGPKGAHRVSADGKILTIDIVSRSDPSDVIGTLTAEGRGIVLDANNRAVSGFVEKLSLNRIAETGAVPLIQLEQTDLLDGFLDWIQTSTEYHELAYRAYTAGWRDYEDRLGDTDNAEVTAFWQANPDIFSDLTDQDAQSYFVDIQRDRYWNEHDIWSRAPEIHDASNVTTANPREENGFSFDGVGWGGDDQASGFVFIDSPLSDKVEVASFGTDRIDLSNGGRDIISVDNFYIRSVYMNGGVYENTDGSSVYYRGSSDLLPENYIDRDELVSFDFSNRTTDGDIVTFVQRDEYDDTNWYYSLQQTSGSGNGSSVAVTDVQFNFGDYDADGQSDDLLLTIDNATTWVTFDDVDYWRSVEETYEIAFIDPIGLGDISTSAGQAAAEDLVKKHLIVAFEDQDNDGSYEKTVSLFDYENGLSSLSPDIV